MDTQQPPLNSEKRSKSWKTPTEFPRVPEGSTIAVDTEAHCEDLEKKGQQFLNGEDFVCGISMALENGFREYYPIAHESGNCEMNVVGYFEELLKRPDITAVGANWKFDIEGLYKVGIKPKCKLADMQVTEALLDENQISYRLNDISIRRGLGKKSPGELEEELVRRGFVKRGKPDWSQIHRLPPKYVGPYAADDAFLTLQCHIQQMPEISDQDLSTVYDLECALIPMLWDMRRVGQPIDFDAADELNANMGLELEDKYKTLIGLAGKGEVDPFSPQSLGTWVRALGYEPPKTALTEKGGGGNDSVGNDWMMATKDPILVAMAEYRQGERFRRDVIEGVLINQSYKSRIHASWYSTRGVSFMAGEDGGTRSGRLSSGNPSLQVIPARHPTYGPMVRKMFLPEQGERFYKGDYNSQEIRIGVHFAKRLNLPGADTYVNRYLDNPAFDYHDYVKEMLNVILPVPIIRGTAKTTGLSLQYGMGKAKLAARLGMKASEATDFLDTFHTTVPWVKKALEKAMDIANQRGYVRSILGRRRRFDEWENANYGAGWSRPLKNKKEAILTWGKIKRAGTYKAWNSVVQSTAAEMTKSAMILLYKDGILPRMTIHDELTASIGSMAEAKRAKDMMEHAIELCIPVLVDATLADDWAGTNKEHV